MAVQCAGWLAWMDGGRVGCPPGPSSDLGGALAVHHWRIGAAVDSAAVRGPCLRLQGLASTAPLSDKPSAPRHLPALQANGVDLHRLRGQPLFPACRQACGDPGPVPEHPHPGHAAAGFQPVYLGQDPGPGQRHHLHHRACAPHRHREQGHHPPRGLRAPPDEQQARRRDRTALGVVGAGYGLRHDPLPLFGGWK